MRSAACLWLAVAAVLASAPRGFSAEDEGDSVILDGFSYRRAHLQVSEPVIRHGGSQLQGHPAELEPLPQGWTEPGFDDTVWVAACPRTTVRRGSSSTQGGTAAPLSPGFGV